MDGLYAHKIKRLRVVRVRRTIGYASAIGGRDMAPDSQ